MKLSANLCLEKCSKLWHHFYRCDGRITHSRSASLRAFTVAFINELPQTCTESSDVVAVPAKPKQSAVPDEFSTMKKELEKAYERIAALEERNQELTLQTPGVCALNV